MSENASWENFFFLLLFDLCFGFDGFISLKFACFALRGVGVNGILSMFFKWTKWEREGGERKKGRKEWDKEGRKEGYKEGRKEVDTEGRKKGDKEGRKEGDKKGRKEGDKKWRKEGD